MKREPFLLALFTLLIVITTAACSSAANNAPEPAGQSAPQPAAAVQAAPVCQGTNTCKPPTAEQNKIDCVNKIPYTNVLIRPGTKFEVVDRSGDFKCSESGSVVDGKVVLSCYGRELYAFDLKLTNPDCGAVSLEMGTGQCQEGYGYDAAQQCCSPVSGVADGSATVRVNLGACPLPRP